MGKGQRMKILTMVIVFLAKCTCQATHQATRKAMLMKKTPPTSTTISIQALKYAISLMEKELVKEKFVNMTKMPEKLFAMKLRNRMNHQYLNSIFSNLLLLIGIFFIHHFIHHFFFNMYVIPPGLTIIRLFIRKIDVSIITLIYNGIDG